MLYGFFSPTAARQITTFIYLTTTGKEVEVTRSSHDKHSSSGWEDEAPVGELARYLRPGSQPLPPIETTEGAPGSTWREVAPPVIIGAKAADLASYLMRDPKPAPSPTLLPGFDEHPARALLAEMVDAFDRVFNSQVNALGSQLTAGQRLLLDEAWEVSIKARDLLGVPWPRDCVRPAPDPATTPSPG